MLIPVWGFYSGPNPQTLWCGEGEEGLAFSVSLSPDDGYFHVPEAGQL